MQSGWRDGILWSVIEAKLSRGKLSREGDSDTSGMFYNCTNRRDGNERAFERLYFAAPADRRNVNEGRSVR
jgi:hypothetical protein